MGELNGLLLGLDIGTTGTKCIVIDCDGNMIANAYQEYPIHSPQPGWAEQDANDWWDAVLTTVKKCTSDEKVRNSIVSIGLSSQGGTMVPVDINGEPLRKAIVWLDGRGSRQGNYIKEKTPENYFYLTTGWQLGSGLNAVEILWMKENEPDLFARTYKFLSTIDFIAMKLTGEYCIDPSNAGISQLINLMEFQWDGRILELVGINDEKLPKVVNSGEVIGKLNPNTIQELGLSKQVTVVSGGHDQYCVALGAGATSMGDILLATGTAWVMMGISEKPMFDINTFAAQSIHTVKGMWGSMQALGNGGVCLEWFRKKMEKTAKNTEIVQLEEYKEIDCIAGQRPPGANGITFYPYFNGSAAPNWDINSKGTFLGLELCHDRYDMMRAIMEGVAFQSIWMLDSLNIGKSELHSLKMLGGATKSKIWAQMVADIIDKPVIIPELMNTACVGAVILAGTASGIFKDAEDGYKSLVKKEIEILPDKRNSCCYKDLFSKYKKRSEYIKEIYNV